MRLKGMRWVRWDGVGWDMLGCLPVAFASALLFGVGWGFAGVAGFAEVLGEGVFWDGGAVGDAGVVAVSGLVGAGHWRAGGVSEAIGWRLGRGGRVWSSR